jgi:serine protease Do
MSPTSCILRLLLGVLAAGVATGCASWPQPGLENLHRTTVLVEHPKGHGTGAIVGPNAILTAEHVVEDEGLEITFFKREARPGRVKWRDPVLDLALVEVEVPQEYLPPEIYCGDLVAGQHLVLVGHPTYSRWVAVGGHLPGVQAFEGHLVPLGFPIGLGTSGGPVFDGSGRIVGVALAILAERSSASANFDQLKDTGIGLMLPAKVFCGALPER